MKKLVKSLMGLALVATQAMSLSACSSTGDSGDGKGSIALEIFTADDAGFNVTSTLISGERDAILVDAQFTRSQAALLGDTIAKSGKRLTTIYITHAHPDHFFGLEILQQRFPDARIIARPTVVAEMKAEGPGKIEQWKPLYKDDLTDTLVDAEPYEEDKLDLEGHEIRILGPLQGDIEHEFPLYVPELKAVIAGDAVYSGVHVWLADADLPHRLAWIEAMKELSALQPETVIAGHKKPALDNSPAALEQTSAYIEEFNRVVAESKTVEEVQQKMLATYSDFNLPIVLELSAKAAMSPPSQ
jgi:glyoxylase-like metal-dependent hydrolase (beta-lactamase superfamily II)